MASNKAFEAKRGKGRPKGSVNKVSIQLRTALESKGFDVAEKLIELYNDCCADPDLFNARKDVLLRILKYTHPMIKELDLNENPTDENAKPVAIQLQDLIKIARGDAVE